MALPTRAWGIPQATSYRYLDEVIDVLAARAPDLHDALQRAQDEGWSHVVLDGKVVDTDRLRVKTLSKKGKTIDAWYQVRQHWGIENKSHYVRDTSWREDHHQAWVGNGPHTTAALRNFAIGLLRLNGLHKIKEATEAVSDLRKCAVSLSLSNP